MANFVLVHGGGHGGWFWRDTAERLRAAGHRVATPTLTGLADRSHLLTPDVNLDTHVTDVVNTIKYEEFDRFVLCGHSYGGAVITGVAEQLESRIDAIVYLDGIILDDGQSVLGRAGVPAPDTLSTPPTPVEVYAIRDPKARAWVEALVTPHPTASAIQPLRGTGAYQRIPKKIFVFAEGFAGATQMMAESYARFCQDPSWKTYKSSGGHHLTLDDPELVMAVLEEAART